MYVRPSMRRSGGSTANTSLRRCRVATAFVVSAVWPVTAAALPPALLDVLEVDPVAAYAYGGPDSTAGGAADWSSVGLAAFVLDQARDVGLLRGLSDRSRAWIDAFTVASEICAFPHLLAVIDVSARPRPDGGHELSGLRAVLVIQTNGANAAVEQRIQQLLNRYANRDESELTRATRRGTDIFTLRDRRLPPWATISWGRLGDSYVVTIGEGSFEGVQAAAISPKTGAGGPWIRSALAARGVEGLSFAGYVDFDRLRQRTDTALARKVEYVQYELGLAGAGGALLTVGRTERAVEVAIVTRRPGGDRTLALAGAALPDGWPEWVIPPQAGRYTVLHVKPSTLYRGIWNSLYASKGPRNRERMREGGERFEEAVGMDIEDGLLARLPGPVVIHDYPRPVMLFPLACTMVTRIEGDPQTFRTMLDRFLEGARDELPPTAPLRWERDADGVWFLRCGIVGPAVGVVDSWLVVSVSPPAVRENLSRLSSRPESGYVREQGDR